MIGISYTDPFGIMASINAKNKATFEQQQRQGAGLVQSYLGRADGSVGASVGAAQSGVQAAGGGTAAADAALAASQGALSNARAVQTQNAARIGIMNSDADAMRTAAGNVSAISGGMAQDTAALRGDASGLRVMATDLTGRAAPWLQTGADILNLNPNATGLAGEWNKYYASLSPDALVSFAASDAQRSIDNTRGQMVRTLTGMGVSPGSAAFGAALEKAKIYEQALLSGVKTRARMLGIREQGSALTAGLQMALNATNMGATFTQQALGATTAAADVTGKAAGVEQQRGSLEAAAGQLRQGAAGVTEAGAQLALGGAGAVTSASGAVTGAAGARVSAGSALTGAYATLAQAQQTAAEYYSTQASSILGLLQGGTSNALAALFA